MRGSAPREELRPLSCFGNDTMTIVDVSVGKNGNSDGETISVTSPK
jgi:hypothetical protein